MRTRALSCSRASPRVPLCCTPQGRRLHSPAQTQPPMFLVSERTASSQWWSYPPVPSVLQGKCSPHFPHVAEEDLGTGMGLFCTGEGCELLLGWETFVTALLCLGKLWNLSCISISPTVKFLYLPARSTVINLSSTSEIKISHWVLIKYEEQVKVHS